MISLLLTVILGFALDSCNNKDIILILGNNYNIINKLRMFICLTSSYWISFIAIVMS